MGRHRLAGDVGVTPIPVAIERRMPEQIAAWLRAPYRPRFAAGDTSLM